MFWRDDDGQVDANARYSVDPTKDPQARGDPFRTLFVARLSYDVKESDLEREFGRFGPVERVIFYYHLGHKELFSKGN